MADEFQPRLAYVRWYCGDQEELETFSSVALH